jgi:hypothetical protein
MASSRSTTSGKCGTRYSISPVYLSTSGTKPRTMQIRVVLSRAADHEVMRGVFPAVSLNLVGALGPCGLLSSADEGNLTLAPKEDAVLDPYPDTVIIDDLANAIEDPVAFWTPALPTY